MARMRARETRAGRPHRAMVRVALALLALSPSVRARVAEAGIPAGTAPAWGSVALLGGSTFIDPRLANYQWDTRPRAAWGAQALVGRGRVALGARAWRSQTVQVLDLPGGPVTPG